MTKNNNYLWKYAYIGISQIQPIKSQTIKHITTRGGTIKPISPDIYHLPATHRITLPCRCWSDNFKITNTDYAHPEQDVGIAIWSLRSIFERYAGSKFLFYDDNLYHILTWTDVLGSRHHKDTALYRIQNHQLILFCNQRTEDECKSLAEMFQSEDIKFIS